VNGPDGYRDYAGNAPILPQFAFKKRDCDRTKYSNHFADAKLANGVYFLHIMVDGKLTVKKMEVVRLGECCLLGQFGKPTLSAIICCRHCGFVVLGYNMAIEPCLAVADYQSKPDCL
jgi:hypothetical protein